MLVQSSNGQGNAEVGKKGVRNSGGWKGDHCYADSSKNQYGMVA